MDRSFLFAVLGKNMMENQFGSHRNPGYVPDNLEYYVNELYHQMQLFINSF